MKGKPDHILLASVIMLILLGVVILTSVSAALSLEKFNSSTFYLFHHIVYGLLPGILLGFLAFKMPLNLIKKWAPLLLLFNLMLLILVFMPKIGLTLGGARSWINLGFASFQPSEFLKLTFVLYLASWLAIRTEKSRQNFSKTLVAFLAAIGLIGLLLILQPDIGTLGIIVMTGVVMYFLAGTPLRHSFLMVLGIGAALAALIKIAPYRLARISVFFNPDIDPMGIGYQVKQALIAVGSGGILGRGLGMSVQRYGFLPQPMADSIFACYAEEWGLIGALVLIALLMVFIWRGFTIAKNTTNKFFQLTALGLTGWLALQAFINIGSMVGILPLTGIPLPFISYGGSALITSLVGVGILLNISKQT